MTPLRRRNLERLLKPRHVALIGGQDAVTVAGECARIGYEGQVWPVNPKRYEIGGHPCFAGIDDLPEAPDAVFLAIPREPAIEAMRALSARGAGGAVVYTAGFGEMGDDGAELEAGLIEAAGDMALVGPNCYGLINYLDQLALWPFAHGGYAPGYGAAIITQSGMLASDLTMSQRSVPFAFMISAGNQAVLALEDFVDVLCERPEVRAIGLHIEGLKDVAQFCQAAHKARQAGKPIVALKTGSSIVGASLTESHTGSLSGSDELYSALFDKLGIIRVQSPAQLLETLKFLVVAGIPKGNSVAGLTCSGGGATMLADYGETVGLTFSPPSAKARDVLSTRLPHTATVSNPLDYTTPIWGDEDRVPPVFSAHVSDGHDAAVLVQDYPLPGLDESKVYYLNDARSFAAAVTAAGLPGAVCSTLPENMDVETRELLISLGIAPMQGLPETLDALSASAWLGRRWQMLEGQDYAPVLLAPLGNDTITIDEAEGKAALAAAGIGIPEGRTVTAAEAPEIAQELGFPVVLKMLGPKLLHKTEAGAVVLNLRTPDEVAAAVGEMIIRVGAYHRDAVTDRFLLERMANKPIAELLVSVRREPDFGLAMTLASGGVLVELVGDAVTILMPADDAEISRALSRLRVSDLLAGFRGGASADLAELIAQLQLISRFVQTNTMACCEVEINPMYVGENDSLAVDVLLRRHNEKAS